MAAKLGKAATVRALIDRGADVLGRNEYGEMVYDIAKTRNDHETIQVLQASYVFLRDASYRGKGTKRRRDGSVSDVPPTLRRHTED